MNEWTDGWTDGQTDRQTDRHDNLLLVIVDNFDTKLFDPLSQFSCDVDTVSLQQVQTRHIYFRGLCYRPHRFTRLITLCEMHLASCLG